MKKGNSFFALMILGTVVLSSCSIVQKPILTELKSEAQSAESKSEVICKLLSTKDAAQITGLPVVDISPGYGDDPSCAYIEKSGQHLFAVFLLKNDTFEKLKTVAINNGWKIEPHDEIQKDAFLERGTISDPKLVFCFKLNNQVYIINRGTFSDNVTDSMLLALGQAIIKTNNSIPTASIGTQVIQTESTQNQIPPNQKVKRTSN